MAATIEKEPLAATSAPANGEARPSDIHANDHDPLFSVAEPERNTIFDSLVRVEGEVAGLVAYSIYKQNKRAWLNDFQKIVGRPPTEAETRAYIIGESTDRRLATYRHLAQATLTGQGPEGPSAERTPSLARRPVTFYLLWAIVIIVALGILGFAWHSAVSAPK
jgi:hypothetical protein